MRRTQMKPYTRVGFVVLAFIVVLGVIWVVAGIAERSSRERLDRVNRPITTNFGTITELRDAFARSRSTLSLSMFAPPAERGRLIAGATGDNTAAQKTLERYLASPLVLPDERELRDMLSASYDTALGRGTTLGLLIANPETSLGDPVVQADIYAAYLAFANNDRVVMQIIDGYQALQAREIALADKGVNDARRLGFGMGTVGIALLIGFSVLMFRSARREYREQRAHEAERAGEIYRTEFETRLQRALDLAENEDEVYPVVGEALASTTEGAGYSELLLADSSRAHFRVVAATEPHSSAGCPVSSPDECPAARRGQPIVFTNSDALDACRHLRNRADGACSALCDPVRIAGGTLGVVHTTGPVNEPPDTEVAQLIDLVTRKTAERIGMLRAFAQAETQARTDALTGLLNRRSLESEAQRALVEGSRYVVAYGDLDLFKQVNDVHGHAAGDRALRVVARALRDSVRPSDLVARYGGEEFVIVLPDCDTVTATEVVERVRERFLRYLEAAAAPRVTVSFGIASGDRLADFDDVLAHADEALLAAKAAGRDRVIISGDELATVRPRPVDAVADADVDTDPGHAARS